MSDAQSPPRRRRGPKPRGRKVVPVNFSITFAQRATIEALAEEWECSVSAVLRTVIEAGLAAIVPEEAHPAPPDSN